MGFLGSLWRSLRPPRTGILMIEEAAAAVIRIMGENERGYTVFVTDIHPRVKDKPFSKDDHLCIKLEVVRGIVRRRRHDGYIHGKVMIAVSREYIDFLIGGRVLHYMECVDGSGFILWPYEKHRALQNILQSDGLGKSGAGS